MVVRMKTFGWVAFIIAVIIYTICFPFVTVFLWAKEVFMTPYGIIKGYKIIWDEVSRKYWY
jgi:hypothetical protein